MKGYIIKLNNEFLNWQGLWTPMYDCALFFITSEKAQTIAAHFEGSSVVEYESPNVSQAGVGSFFDYHNSIG